MLHSTTGSLVYSYVLPALVAGAVSAGRGQFYVGSFNGYLYAFGTKPVAGAPPDLNCPLTFNCRDIGNPMPGSETTSLAGVLTVKGSGATIAGTSDQFRYIYKTIKGDSQANVRITAQSTQNFKPQAGLMVRQNSDPSSPFFAIWADPNDLSHNLPNPDILIFYRATFGGPVVELTKWYPAFKPVSIMIQRQGNIFSAGISFDAVKWQLIPGASADLDLPAWTMQGIMVNSGAG